VIAMLRSDLGDASKLDKDNRLTVLTVGGPFERRLQLAVETTN